MPSGYGVFINGNGIYRGSFEGGSTHGPGKYEAGEMIVEGTWDFG